MLFTKASLWPSTFLSQGNVISWGLFPTLSSDLTSLQVRPPGLPEFATCHEHRGATRAWGFSGSPGSVMEASRQWPTPPVSGVQEHRATKDGAAGCEETMQLHRKPSHLMWLQAWKTKCRLYRKYFCPFSREGSGNSRQ